MPSWLVFLAASVLATEQTISPTAGAAPAVGGAAAIEAAGEPATSDDPTMTDDDDDVVDESAAGSVPNGNEQKVKLPVLTGDHMVQRSKFSYSFSQVQRLNVGTAVALGGFHAPRYGYTPLIIDVAGMPAPAGVDVSFRHSWGMVKPRSRRNFWATTSMARLEVPLLADAPYGTLRLESNAWPEEQTTGMSFAKVWGTTRVVLSLGSPEEFERLVRRKPTQVDPQVIVVALNAEQFPSEFASLVGYDAVVLPAKPVAEVPESVRRAIEQYAATGGTVVLGETDQPPADILPLYRPSAQELSSGYGFGTLVACRKCAPHIRSVLLAGTDRAVTPQPPSVGQSHPFRGGRLGPSVGGAVAEDSLLLPQAVAPVSRFLLIILVFTALIGPGSYWVARRYGTSALLLTIPSTAVATCISIIAISAVQDGFATHACVQGYTWLDAKNRRAASVGLLSLYANSTPTAVQFSPGTVLLAGNENAERSMPSDIQWNEGMRVSGDFLAARTYREWGVLATGQTNARVSVVNNGAGVDVLNGLGSDVEALCFVNGGERRCVFGVPQGGRATSRIAHADSPSEPAALFTNGLSAANRFDDRLNILMYAPLLENEFIAVARGPGLLPTGDMSLEHHNSLNVIRGEVEP